MTLVLSDRRTSNRVLVSRQRIAERGQHLCAQSCDQRLAITVDSPALFGCGRRLQGRTKRQQRWLRESRLAAQQLCPLRDTAVWKVSRDQNSRGTVAVRGIVSERIRRNMAAHVVEPLRFIASNVALKAEEVIASTATNFGTIAVYSATGQRTIECTKKIRSYTCESWTGSRRDTSKRTNTDATVTLLITDQCFSMINTL